MLISKEIIEKICIAYDVTDVAAQIFNHIYIDSLIDCFEPDNDNDLPFKIASQERIDYVKHYSNITLPIHLQKKFTQWIIFQEMFSKM